MEKSGTVLTVKKYTFIEHVQHYMSGSFTDHINGDIKFQIYRKVKNYLKKLLNKKLLYKTCHIE